MHASDWRGLYSDCVCIPFSIPASHISYFLFSCHYFCLFRCPVGNAAFCEEKGKQGPRIPAARRGSKWWQQRRQMGWDEMGTTIPNDFHTFYFSLFTWFGVGIRRTGVLLSDFRSWASIVIASAIIIRRHWPSYYNYSTINTTQQLHQPHSTPPLNTQNQPKSSLQKIQNRTTKPSLPQTLPFLPAPTERTSQARRRSSH